MPETLPLIYRCGCPDAVDNQDFLDFDTPCPGHHWSDWQINDHFPLREDRFCHICGGMETQELRTDA
jgi:hypothetical protein